jgi:putative spermidine/putrescine transport system ATP-binding protein
MKLESRSSPTHSPSSELGLGGLIVQGLSIRIAGFVLEADFAVNPGDRAVVTGPSGSGKTTLLRVISGLRPLEPADRGKIFLQNREITHLAPQHREMGFVFQDATLFPSMSVLENVIFGLKMHGVSREQQLTLADEWLKKVDLLAKKNAGVENLSGGEKKRIAFIRALIWKPKLLLLDEPFSALDPGLRSALRQQLLDLHQLWPVPVFMVTHDQQDIETLATTRFDLSPDKNSPIRKMRKG